MNNKDLFIVLAYVPQGLILLCVMTGLFRLKSLGKLQKLLLTILLITGVSEVVSEVLWQQSNNNFPVFHIYAILEFCVLAMIYRSTFENKTIESVFKWSILVFITFGIANALFFQSVFEPNTNVTTVSSVLLIGLSVSFLFRVLNDMRYDRLEKSAMFWINIGVLTYFSSSFALFTFGEKLVPFSIESTINIWTLHIFFNVLHYIAFCIALWMKPE
ncbi:MAG: hypothetical protein HEP71_15935 [Roseivirga sp.]|nr:hypothetical protein [Roseivirga sp.]